MMRVLTRHVFICLVSVAIVGYTATLNGREYQKESEYPLNEQTVDQPQTLVQPKVITVCGELHGHGYYFGGVLTGWKQDSISGGTDILVQDSHGNFDILYTDRFTGITGKITSMRDDGGIVTEESISTPDLRIVRVVNTTRPDAVEMFHYVFKLDEFGNGTLGLTHIRKGYAPKVAVFSSVCQAP